MSDDPSIEELADGMAAWQEHRPQTIADWMDIARRFSEQADDLDRQLAEARAEAERLRGILHALVKDIDDRLEQAASALTDE